MTTKECYLKMAPSKGNRNNFRKKKPEKYQRMLAIFEKNWPTDDETTEIKLGNTKRVQYYVPFLILTGTKKPEPFLIWLLDYRSKIANNKELTSEEKYNLIQTMVKGKAKARVHEVFVAVNEPTFTVIGDKNNFDWKSPIMKHCILICIEHHISTAGTQVQMLLLNITQVHVLGTIHYHYEHI